MSESPGNHAYRFGGIERLYGPGSLDRLHAAHVCVIGLGGVGSWTAEALARSGIGKLTLIDLDDICESNVNRQIHALEGSIGQPKIEAMAARCRLINPKCMVVAIHSFFTEKNADSLLASGFDFVVDAIDSFRHKSALIAACRDRGTPIIACGGAGGRIDPTQIRIADLAKTYNDRLLFQTRKLLRVDYRFPTNIRKKFKIDCVFSPEPVIEPAPCELGEENGSHRLDCSTGFGAAAYVTGAFGFAAASHVVSRLAAPPTILAINVDR